MQRLLIVSNRLPISVTKSGGEYVFKHSVGGLATALSSFYKTHEALWLGWSGIPGGKLRKGGEEVVQRLKKEKCVPVFLSQNEIDDYYFGFSNETIWPLFHYFTQNTVYNDKSWKSYKKVNQVFCDAVLKTANKRDIIWIHDYHLFLLPAMLREKLPEATIGFFLHIPFPSYEIFRLLPWRHEILEGMLGADLVGFHTYDYASYFLNNVRRIVGFDSSMNLINGKGRKIKVDVFPIGIDYDKFSQATGLPETKKEVRLNKKRLGDLQIILSVDRLDYTKGIYRRLLAFGDFLEKYPEFIGKVTLVLLIVPSRTKVERYQMFKRQVEELVGRINGKFGRLGYSPIWYLYRSLSLYELTALYSMADVALVTPMRDGMNLVAKEYIATKADGNGMLILSETAGAATELGEALLVNPNNLEQVRDAIREALLMPLEEKVVRNKVMQQRLKRYDVARWGYDFIRILKRTKEVQNEFSVKILTKDLSQKMVEEYRKACKRLLLLDYDGTLVSFKNDPEKATPDNEIIHLLKGLSEKSENELVIASGRNKESLDKMLGTLKVGMVAEHGVWVKEKQHDWQLLEHLHNEWKKEVITLLEFYVDRTPGSFIEEKEYSLVWHYRKVEFDLALIRARELSNDLHRLTGNLHLDILEGSKVIEIKNAGINKGKAVLKWLKKENWDFILAIGDDWTDETMFAVLPEDSYSIKVGGTLSKAKFNVNSFEDVRKLLKQLRRNGNAKHS